MEEMVTDAPLVSVIMNCYNSAKYLREAIDSVYAQSFTDWEIVFFDNGSTDDSPMIAKHYDEKLCYFRGEMTVPLGHARNLAMAKARGKYIAFLDCDDIWCAEKLARQVSVMEADQGVGAVYSDALFFNDTGRSFRTFPGKGGSQGMIFGDLLRRYVLPMPTIMIRRYVLDKVGGWFDERFNMVEDADLFMRIAYYFPVAYVDDVLAKRRMHAGSWTAMKKELFPKEEEMLLAKFSSLWPTFEKDFVHEIAHMKAIIQYQYAVIDWETGHAVSARHRMRPYLGAMKKMWVPFLFSYVPIAFYRVFKRGYKMLTVWRTGGVDDQAF